MDSFLIRLLIAIGVIWIAQLLLAEFGIQEPARKVIFVIVLVVALLFLVTGGTYFPIK